MTLTNITPGNPFDIAFGTPGDDVIVWDGLPADQLDILRSSPGIEAIALQGGNDTALDNNEPRFYFGNAGNDTLSGNGGRDSLIAGRDNDLVNGGDDDDIVSGNLGNDIVDGGNGNDFVVGGQNEDFLIGGPGNDVLSGDVGVDTLTGGPDTDFFRLGSPGRGVDIITDFEVGVDRIQLPSSLAFSEIRVLETGPSQSTIIFNETEEALAILENVPASTLVGTFEATGTNFITANGISVTAQPGALSSEALNLGELNGVINFSNFVTIQGVKGEEKAGDRAKPQSENRELSDPEPVEN